MLVTDSFSLRDDSIRLSPRIDLPLNGNGGSLDNDVNFAGWHGKCGSSQALRTSPSSESLKKIFSMRLSDDNAH